MQKEIALSIETNGIPEWIRILPLGLISLGDGRPGFEVDQEAVDNLIKQFTARGLDMVIDYEHQTLEGGQAPAAGWIKALEGRADGLWARVEWTERGQGYLQNREYRYFSPVLTLDPETRRPLALHHVALTNTPAINHLPPLVAKAEFAKPRDLPREVALVPEDEQLMQEQLEKYRSQRVSNAETAKASGEQLNDPGLFNKQEILKALELPETSDNSQILASIARLKREAASVASLRRMLAKLKAIQDERESQKLMELALKSGKVTPAQRTWAMEYAQRDPEGFKLFLAQAPKIIPLGEQLDLIQDSRPRPHLSPSQAGINQLMGISDEIYFKYNSEGRE